MNEVLALWLFRWHKKSEASCPDYRRVVEEALYKVEAELTLSRWPSERNIVLGAKAVA